jgi:hypothetical protein
MLQELPAGIVASTLTKLEGSRVTFTVAKRRAATVSLAAAATEQQYAAGAK